MPDLTLADLQTVFPDCNTDVLDRLLPRLNKEHLDKRGGTDQRAILDRCQQTIVILLNALLQQDHGAIHSRCSFSQHEGEKGYKLVFEIKSEEEDRPLAGELSSFLRPYIEEGIVEDPSLFSSDAVRDISNPPYAITSFLPFLLAYILEQPELAKDWRMLFKEGSSPYQQLTTWTEKVKNIEKTLKELIDICVNGTNINQEKAFQQLPTVLRDWEDIRSQLASEIQGLEAQQNEDIAFFLRRLQKEMDDSLEANLGRLLPAEAGQVFGQPVQAAPAVVGSPGIPDAAPVSADPCSAPHLGFVPARPAQRAAAAVLPATPAFFQAAPQREVPRQRTLAPPALPDVPEPSDKLMLDSRTRMMDFLEKFRRSYPSLSIQDFLSLLQQALAFQKHLYDQQLKIIYDNQAKRCAATQERVFFLSHLINTMDRFLVDYFKALGGHLLTPPPNYSPLCPTLLMSFLKGEPPPECPDKSDRHRDSHIHPCNDKENCKSYQGGERRHIMRYAHNDQKLIAAICAALDLINQKPASREAIIFLLEMDYKKGYPKDNALLFQAVKNPDGSLITPEELESLCKEFPGKTDLQTGLKLARYIEWVLNAWLPTLRKEDERCAPIQEFCTKVKELTLDFYFSSVETRARCFKSSFYALVLEAKIQHLDRFIPYINTSPELPYVLLGALWAFPPEFTQAFAYTASMLNPPSW